MTEKNKLKTYRKIATVEAKLFKKGDEDGFEIRYTDNKESIDGKISTWGFRTDKENIEIKVPYIKTLENQRHLSRGFNRDYLCVGIEGEKWLVEKEIFEKTYVKI